MTAFFLLIAGAIAATAAIFIARAIVRRNNLPFDEMADYDEGDGLDGEDYMTGCRWAD